MKRIFYTIIVFLTAIFASNAQAYKTVNKAEGRPTIAVVLAGGGAKGMAHLGAIKVIESCGIPIDMIVGTSMGSIVGGLYSIGYTSDELLDITRGTDWINLILDTPDYGNQLLTAKKDNENYLLRVSLDRSRVLSGTGGGGIIDGKNIYTLFRHLTEGLPEYSDFNKFPIPFACVATNAVTGEKYVFHEGDLVTAMRSSMAIPTVFTPVKVGDAALVDGFVVDNFPVDVARQMGADIIIGVDLVSESNDDALANSAIDVMMRILDFNSMDQYQANKDDTDIYIPINTTGYSAASFSSTAIDSLILRGEQAAKENIEELRTLARRLNINQSYYTVHGRMNGVNYTRTVNDLHPDLYIDTKDVAIIRTDSAGIIDLSETIKQGYLVAKNIFQSGSLSLGARFDNQEYAALQLGIDVKLLRRSNVDLNIYGRLGARMMGGISVAHLFRNGGKIEARYRFEHKDISAYLFGDRIADVGDYHQRFNLRYKQDFRKVSYSFGLRYDVDRYRNVLIHKDVANIAENLPKEKFFSYYTKAEFNNLDAQYFPTKGSQVEVMLEVITSNLYEFHNYALFPIISGYWRTAATPGKRFSFIPHASIRIVGSGDAPTPWALRNFLGGFHRDYIKEQQIEMAGLTHMEIINKEALGVFGFDLQQRIGGNHFIIATFDGASMSNNFDEAFTKDALHWGCNLGYHYRGVAGPISVIGMWNQRTKDIGLQLNVGYYF